MIAPNSPSRRAFALLLLCAAAGATAQTTTPSPAAPTLIPGVGNFTIANPAPAPTPQSVPIAQPTAQPTATPTPLATTTAAPIAPPTANAPRRARSAPTLTPPPTPTSTPLPAVTPVAPPVALATPEPTPQVTAAPPVVTAAPTASSFPTLGAALAALALLVLAGLAWFFLRRRHEPEEEQEEIAALPEQVTPPVIAPPPAAAPPPVPTPSPPPSFLRTAPVARGPRAWIELGMRPIRAGTNVTSAAVDYEITLRNAGDAAATDIRIDIVLISAAADQDGVLSAFFASPIPRPVTAPFDLAAGDGIALAGMAMTPRETLHVVAVQDRALFVPMFALNVRYDWAGGQGGQTANAWVIGIERADGGKMQPFRLDTGPRMYDKVGPRPHSFAITT